jgi:outer membrane protein OmpA-like peptidoglycan-associated protein
VQIIHKVLLLIIIPIFLVQPQKKNSLRTHNFSGTVPVTIAGVITLGQTDYKIAKVGFGATGMVEYFLPISSPTILGFRLLLGGQTVNGKDNVKIPAQFRTDMVTIGGGLTAGYSFNEIFFPYVYGGVSNIWFSPKDEEGNRLENNMLGVYSTTAISYDGEIGTRVKLVDMLSLLFSIGVHFTQTDNIDDVAKGNFVDYYYSGRIGISLSLFGKKDYDGDGILDSDDLCPSNPEDYDGFQDEDGCPDFDNDKDKILDERDKCPNDAEDKDGYQDDDGCPDLDNDGDGIPDIKDKCPNEAENFNGFEDEDGCPDILSSTQKIIDSDKDGILDSADKCPDQAETINGFKDDDGCPDTVQVIDSVSTKEILLEGFNLFDWNSAVIKPTAYEELDKVVVLLENDPFIKWAVESYTDNNGVPDSLKLLSKERSKAVVLYFINKGLPSFMFKVFGKGSESPIADNKTLEGRMKNNRIVIKRLN